MGKGLLGLLLTTGIDSSVLLPPLEGAEPLAGLGRSLKVSCVCTCVCMQL